MPIEISSDDVSSAETFLETLLTEEIPTGRFTQGSALRDLVIKSLAFTFAHLKKENTTIRSLQSLLTVQDIATTDPDTDRAVANATDAILSNWFLTRRSGGFSRGVVFLEVSRRQDYIIPGNHRFAYDKDHIFYPDVLDTTQSIVIPASSLLPVLATDGTVSAYQFSQIVIAAKTGEDYNVSSGNWKSGTSFSPFATRVFSSSKFEGGKGRESTSELIARSSTAISVRNLINPRSIDATLRERYSVINRLLVVGMGDPEMQRDLKVEFATTSRLHLGGHYDVYLELPRVQATFEGRLGARYTRPDNLINIFRDTSIVNWTTTSVQLGDVIRVSSGLPEAPKDFVIKEIYATELRVSTNTPFSEATEESATFITYFIYRPLFLADAPILPTVGVNTTGQSSRQIQTANRLVLPGGPHYEILDVAITDPTSGDPFIDSVDGYIHFPVRTNEAPNSVTSAQFLEYQISSIDKNLAQSMVTFEELIIESAYNGKNVRVTYETLAGMETIHAFTQDRFERVVAGNILTKGYHPVYLTMTIPYKSKATATGTVSQDGLRQAVVDFINTFDPNDVIDVSDVFQVVREYDTNIGVVFPFIINYELIISDGRVITYTTEDEVTLTTNKLDDLAGTGFSDPNSFGISDRNVRYMTTYARISVEDRT